MTMGFQLTFDCAEPGRLADFWAAVLHYKPADPPEGFASWEEWLTRNGVPPEEWDDGAAIADPEGARPKLCFLKVPEGKITKNRLHLDLDASSGPAAPLAQRRSEVDAEVERILALGALVVDRYEGADHYHALMRDPEGNEFCVR
jgi:Glyoxalase-like domain